MPLQKISEEDDVFLEVDKLGVVDQAGLADEN